MAKNTTSRKLYDLLVSRGFDPEESNSSGNNVIDPTEADMVKFDYIAPSGKNYGTVVLLLGDDGDLSMFFGDEKGKTMDPEDRNSWFEFLQQLKPWANWNQRDFRAYNMGQLKHHLSSMRKSLAESVVHSLTGNATRSWTASPDSAKMVIHHSRRLGEEDKRYRHIDKIFIETVDGERFKLPFRHLAGAKAMLEHVRHGGNPYDLRGVHITEMVTELNVLSRFRRAHHGKIFEGEAQGLIEQANTYYESIRKEIKRIGSSRGYQHYFESWKPMEVDAADMMVEDLRTMFIEQTLDARIESALPVLARLQQQRNTTKELTEFADWAAKITESTWALPDTPETMTSLEALLKEPELPVGADALDIKERLYDILGDDELNDKLEVLARMSHGRGDAKPLILARLEELGIEVPRHDQEAADQQPATPPEDNTMPPEQTEPTQEMLEFPKVTEEDDFTPTDPKEIGAKMNAPYISPAAKAGLKSTAAQDKQDKTAPAIPQVDVKTTPVPHAKFEDIERIKTLVSYLNR